MRRVYYFLGLCAAVLIVSFVLDFRAVQPPSDDTAIALPSDTVSVGEVEADPSDRVLMMDFARASAREAVPAPEAVAEDPCASVTAELNAALAELNGARSEIKSLRRELADVTRERDWLRLGLDTPYGMFLAGPEADEIIEDIRSGGHLYEETLADLRDALQRNELRVATDPSVHNKHTVEHLSKELQLFSDDREAVVEDVLGSIKAWIDVFPVMLQPGEGTWIAEQVVVGPATEEDLLRFLGLTRVAAELPLDKLFDDFLSDEDYGPELQAALPPEKHAELAAKLDALMEQTDDPEEIEWLLERFPTFFD